MVCKKTTHVLGRFDITHNTIFISRLFDSPKFRSYVTEYVMFHEMLHVKHQCRVQDSRLIVHTPEFRAEEKRFAHYREAKLWLKQALKSSMSCTSTEHVDKLCGKPGVDHISPRKTEVL